jgi:hypothetical protein
MQEYSIDFLFDLFSHHATLQSAQAGVARLGIPLMQLSSRQKSPRGPTHEPEEEALTKS